MLSFLLDRSVAFNLFGLPVYWYGVIITGAIILDFILLLILSKKFNLKPDLAYDLIFAAVLPGIIGARLFSVIFEDGASIADFFAFRDGGMSIIGALIGGAIGLIAYSLIKKQNFFSVTDILVPLVLFAQGIGRWGNYFNDEVYGKLVTNPKLMWFPLSVNIGGQWYQALFFYESVLNIIGAIILIILFIKLNKKRGLTTGAYLVWYGVCRFILESFRQERYILHLGSLPISKLIAGLMVVIGITLIVLSLLGRLESDKSFQNKKIKNRNN